jgi:putative transcriptional regulator
MLNDDIRAARKRAGLTLEGLARILDVSYTTVARWERGCSTPDAETLTRLAEVLGVEYREARLVAKGNGRD